MKFQSRTLSSNGCSRRDVRTRAVKMGGFFEWHVFTLSGWDTELSAYIGTGTFGIHRNCSAKSKNVEEKICQNNLLQDVPYCLFGLKLRHSFAEDARSGEN